MFVAFAILAAMTWFALEPPRNPWFLATIGAGLLFGIGSPSTEPVKGTSTIKGLRPPFDNVGINPLVLSHIILTGDVCEMLQKFERPKLSQLSRYFF